MEKTSYIIMLQYKGVLGVRQKAHSEVFATQSEVYEQLRIMVEQNPKCMYWIVEVPVPEWRPQLTLVEPAVKMTEHYD